MNLWVRTVIGLLLAATVGGLLAFRGDLPRTEVASAAAVSGWSLPAPARPALEAADRIWDERAPWGAPPPPPPPPEPPPPPPPVPVGVVMSGRETYAVFVVRGSALEYRVRRGEKLPDGGRLLKVSRTHVVWKDGKGVRHEQELLADPMSPLRTFGQP